MIKKTIFIVLIFFLISSVFSVCMVRAGEEILDNKQETQKEEKVEEEKVEEEKAEEVATITTIKNLGLLPDSPFYFLKRWQRSFRLFFTFNLMRKIELENSFIEEDLLVLQQLHQQEKSDLVESFFKKIQVRFEKIVQRIDRAREKRNEIEPAIERLRENQTRFQQVLEKISENLPDRAKNNFLRTNQNQTRNLERKIKNIENKQEMDRLRQRMEERRKEVEKDVRTRIEEMIDRKSN